MEYQMVKSAFKSRVLLDTMAPSLVQSQNHLVTDDGLGGDDMFPVDDLLIDFSDEEGEGDGEESFREKEDLGSVSSYDDGGVFDDNDEDGTSSHFLSFSSQLAFPDDDLAELEWVSHFVDDSLPEFPVLYPIKPSGGEPVSALPPCFPAHVPVRPRSKRPRITRKEHPSPPSDSSLSSGNSSTSSCLSFADVGSCQDEPGRKRRRMNRTVRTGCKELQRRCSHCQVQRTPQWRAGPLGPKTLCNACGVRYKSGRLLPEYRPACSPTFSAEIHSNSHRKVLEMRQGKGSEVGSGRVGEGLLVIRWAN